MEALEQLLLQEWSTDLRLTTIPQANLEQAKHRITATTAPQG